MRALTVTNFFSGAKKVAPVVASSSPGARTCVLVSQVSPRARDVARDARAHIHKFLSGRAMRAPMVASCVPGTRCVRPGSQVVACSPSVARSGCRAR